MYRLIFFELGKNIKKRSFLLSIAGILFLNLFLLWYVNLPDEGSPKLSAYRAFEQDIRAMSEEEKLEYAEKLYLDIEGVCLVRDVLQLEASSFEMGEMFAEQMRSEHPGVFEAYYDTYEKGNYLKYTDSLEQESALLTEIYEEMEKVSGYDAYLEGVQNTKGALGGISIFASEETDSFSSRNIEKSASDYKKLENVEITFYPSKGIASAMGNHISDVFLLLVILLFASSLIYEEKEKRLFCITRASVYGRGHSIAAKLLALGIYSIIVTALFYGVNLLFFAGTTGIGDLSRSIQSVAPYMESSLPISVCGYLIGSILTKAMVLFAAGALFTFLSMVSRYGFMSYLAGGLVVLVSWLLYQFIPSYSSFNWLKYLNMLGLMKTEDIYGGYLNFNFFGHPISRIFASWGAIFIYLTIGILISVCFFVKCRTLELKRIELPIVLKPHIHSSLFLHEGYKILVMNRAGMILLVFTGLIGYWYLSGQETLSAKESYYQSVMLQLEGELTQEKEALIDAENKRYEEAFAQIAKIDELVESGEIDQSAGDSMKSRYNSEVAFYPSFQRVLDQYDYVKESGGEFLYDTGYLHLFGILGRGFSVEFLMLSICMVLSFSNGMSMENQKKSWQLLSATKRGRRQVLCRKVLVCALGTCFISLVPWVCRIIRIHRLYPMHGFLASLRSIPHYRNIGVSMPVILWIGLFVLVQVFIVEFVMMVVLLLSYALKSHMRALFAGALILVIPLVLKEMGFDFAEYCSLYPLYGFFT